VTSRFGQRIVVLSPHLDDAALSLGATIAAAARASRQVTVVTVFANDPESTAPPGEWDAKCGFRTAGEAAARRREEDSRACEILGARASWLPFADVEYEQDFDDDGLWAAVANVTSGADTVLAPGFPLAAPDHARLTALLAKRRLPSRLALYVEQPYASWRVIGRGQRTGAHGLTPKAGVKNLLSIVSRTDEGRRLQAPSSPPELSTCRVGDWRRVPTMRRDWLAKYRAVRAYRSQVRAFGPLVLSRVAAYEFGSRGEPIATALDDGEDE
jgi:LmbE family N-acetylglucosaminyl deacetylase